jgi:Beta-lactamase
LILTHSRPSLLGPIVTCVVLAALGGCVSRATRDEALSAAVDDIVRASMKQEGVPGVSLAIAREGKIIKATGYGVANLELNAPVTPQSVTFALVVGAHDEDHVFERNYDHQRPEDRRDAPQHVVRCELDTVIGMKGLLCGVKRTGANVAVNDAKRR